MIASLTDTDPFSDVAGVYDHDFTHLLAVDLVRKRIHALIARYFPPTGAVLDLACGTGEDALLLARRGFRVVAADRSRAMLSVAAAKSGSLSNAPGFVQLDAASLPMIRDSAFDAILSNFGGLNCVPDLRATLRECHRVLQPGGTMVLTLLGANSIWESVAFALRGNWRKAFRRRRGAPVTVRVGLHDVNTWYHSVRFVRRASAGFFDVVAVKGMNIVAPPPASQSFARRYASVTRLLFSLDATIESVPGIRALGDHTVFVLKRRTLP